MPISGRNENFYSSIAEFCVRGLNITTFFRNLSKLRKHVRPGYPHVIKFRKTLIHRSGACDECMGHEVIARGNILLTSPSLRADVANNNSWERFVILCKTI
jgi:hypothetical protein